VQLNIKQVQNQGQASPQRHSAKEEPMAEPNQVVEDASEKSCSTNGSSFRNFAAGDIQPDATLLHHHGGQSDAGTHRLGASTEEKEHIWATIHESVEAGYARANDLLDAVRHFHGDEGVQLLLQEVNTNCRQRDKAA
jgi:hypothetical protein